VTAPESSIFLPSRDISLLFITFCSLTDRPYVARLRAFGALGDVEFDLISFFQGFIPAPLDGRMVDKYVLRTFHFDKPETLLITEPFDFSFRHHNLPLKCDLFVAKYVCKLVTLQGMNLRGVYGPLPSSLMGYLPLGDAEYLIGIERMAVLRAEMPSPQEFFCVWP
jgi:hypothetical protein